MLKHFLSRDFIDMRLFWIIVTTIVLAMAIFAVFAIMTCVCLAWSPLFHAFVENAKTKPFSLSTINTLAIAGGLAFLTLLAAALFRHNRKRWTKT